MECLCLLSARRRRLCGTEQMVIYTLRLHSFVTVCTDKPCTGTAIFFFTLSSNKTCFTPPNANDRTYHICRFHRAERMVWNNPLLSQKTFHRILSSVVLKSAFKKISHLYRYTAACRVETVPWSNSHIFTGTQHRSCRRNTPAVMPT